MLTLPPVKGEISLAGVLPFAGVGGSSRTRVILIIVIVDPFETGPAHFCQTVHLESSFCSESTFLHSKMMTRHPGPLLFFHFSYALEGRI